MKWFNWHRAATVATSVGAFAAAHWIPASMVLTLGPVAIPVAAAVSGVLALAAAAGIQQSPTVSKALAGIAAGKAAADASKTAGK